MAPSPTSSRGASSPVLSTVITFNAAALHALGTAGDSGATLIAAPGSGLAVMPLAIGGSYHFGTTAYENDVQFAYTDAGVSPALNINTSWGAGFINGPTADIIETFQPVGLNALQTPAAVANQPFILWALGPLANGDGLLIVHILYALQTV